MAPSAGGIDLSMRFHHIGKECFQRVRGANEVVHTAKGKSFDMHSNRFSQLRISSFKFLDAPNRFSYDSDFLIYALCFFVLLDNE